MYLRAVRHSSEVLEWVGERPRVHPAALDALLPSAYWGTDRIWETRVNNHNSMFGRDGKIWLAASIRGADNPAFCKQGSDQPSAKAFPMDRAIRHVAVFDPKTLKVLMK